MSRGIVHTHACGGAAASIAENVISAIAGLGDGFAEFKLNYLDTSRVNYDKLADPKGDLFLIKTKSHGKEEINGSGTERYTHAKDIMLNVNDYLNQHKHIRKETNEYHMVIASASGGSGSTASVFVAKALMERDIPVFMVIVGDSSNAMYSINTLNTLATLNKFAIELNKPLSVIYVNNQKYYTNGLSAAEQAANKELFSTLTSVALFLSGDNEAMDNQDMINFIDQSNYRTIKVKPGLYGLHVYSKDINLPEGATPTVSRVLTLQNQDFDLKANMLHYKRGFVNNQNVFSVIKEEQFPLIMVNYANFFSIEEKILKPQTDDYYNIANNITSNQVTGSSNSAVDEETGLIL